VEAYIAQARRDREVCEDFLAANPTQHRCTILRRNSMSKSWKPEVEVNDEWCQNSLVFATKEEAERSAGDLMSRWMLVTDYRAVESDLPANYQIVDGVMSPVVERQLELNLELT
jgi:hypothetical protein